MAGYIIITNISTHIIFSIYNDIHCIHGNTGYISIHWYYISSALVLAFLFQK